MRASLIAIATANPRFRYRQNTLLASIPPHWQPTRRERYLYERFLSDPSIAGRTFCAKNIKELLTEDPAALGKRFEKHAPELSTAALLRSLSAARINADKLGHLTAVTCTGYLCPGLSSYIIERAGLRRNIQALDISGMGCGGALPALLSACHFLEHNPPSYASVVCVELCSCALATGRDAGLILSNSIFGDGFAACLLTNKSRAAGYRIIDMISFVVPEYREHLRFRTENNRMTNQIKEGIAEIAANQVKKIVTELLRRNGIRRAAVDRWALHPGGRKILDTIKGSLVLTENDLIYSRSVLQRYGNMSSPSILYVLKEIMKADGNAGRSTVLCVAFGAGFSVYAALLQR